MTVNTHSNKKPAMLVAALILIFSFLPNFAVAEDSFEEAIKSFITSGKPSIHMRYRYEFVDDDLVPANNAHASTLRTALGYETGVIGGFSAFAEMEHISQLFVDDYREGPYDSIKAGLYPIVADAPGAEVNEAYIRYTGIENLDVKVGRQEITYRKAPFHRFIGNVLWRQNWVTYDAISAKVTPTEKLTINFAYIDKVNRLFGDDAPGAFARFECECLLFNGNYQGFKYVKLESYAYLLDIENAAANSSDTYGIRANGAIPYSETLKFIYAAEFAAQSDGGSNPIEVDANYYLGEIGIGIKVGQPFLQNLILKVDFEVLEGDGTGAFRTPLSTIHAYQGWADRFLTTPADGIQDTYLTAVASGVFGGKIVIAYHMLESDNMSYDYGDELNVQYTRKFKKYFTLGTKAAVYDADRNATALARAGGVQNNDVTKVWFWLQFDY